eukprot:gene18722-13486_t
MTKLTNTGRVYGIELDNTLLKEAYKAAAETLEPAEQSKIDFLQGDAMRLTEMCGDTKFDLIFLANTFHGIPDKQEMLRQMMAVLSDSESSEIVIVNWRTDIPRDQCIVLALARETVKNLALTGVGEIFIVDHATGDREGDQCYSIQGDSPSLQQYAESLNPHVKVHSVQRETGGLSRAIQEVDMIVVCASKLETIHVWN